MAAECAVPDQRKSAKPDRPHTSMAAIDRLPTTMFLRDKTITAADLGTGGLQAAEYGRCTFDKLDLKNANLTGKVFVECIFRDCDMSLAQVGRVSFRDVRFERCKLLGVRFDGCHAFLLSFKFNDCILDLASFHGLRLKGTVFSKCRMRETDLGNADFSKGSFAGCDLGAAVFDGTTLEGADFRGAQHYSIDPANNKIRKARFSVEGLAGLLDRTGIVIDGH